MYWFDEAYLKPGIYEMEGDEDDLGPFGMDANTRKRLKVSRMMKKKSMKPRKPMRTKLPYSLSNVPKLSAREDVEGMSKLRSRSYLGEEVSVPENVSRSGSGGEPGSLSDSTGRYYRSVIKEIAKKLPSSFRKGGDSVTAEFGSYRGSISGNAADFGWYVVARKLERSDEYSPKIEIEAKVGIHKMTFTVPGSASPGSFVGDVAEWMKSKQVVLARKVKPSK